ncbi:MAG: hypothetical protein DMF65_12055 [Acidobacteria bacterium]|nr:MAG: hypothetical protein DMF65_12055 [Acidobacteriota bacterium]
MKPHEDTNADTPQDETPEPRELLLLRAGAHAFAVFADETDGVADGLKPTPLPHAPRAVLGVVCVRGRMRTVLDPLALVGDNEETESATASTPLFIVALRGDEQLALAAESDAGVVRINIDNITPPDTADPSLRGTFEHDGARVLVLDPSRLFDAALRGTERRRRRT